MINCKTLQQMFHEYFSFMPEEKDRVKYELIERYWDKVSKRLKNEYKEIRKRGEERANKSWEEAVETSKRFSNLFEADKFKGIEYHQPVILGNKDDIT